MDVTLPPSLQSITKNKITFGDVNISFPYDLPKDNTQSNLLNQSNNSKYNLIFVGPFLYFTKSTIANSSISISFKMLSTVNPSFVIFIPNFIIKNSTRLSSNENSPNYMKNNFSVTLQSNVHLFSSLPASNFQEININSQTYFIGEIIITFNSSDLLNNFVSSFTTSAFNFQSAIKNCPERELCKIGGVNCIGIINQSIDGRKNNRIYIDENFKVSKAKSCNLVLVHLMDVYSIQLHGTIISNSNDNGGKNEAIACLLDLPINQTTTVLTFSQYQNIASNSGLSKSGSDSNSSSVTSSSSYSFFDQFDVKFLDRFKRKPELSCVFAVSDIENGIEAVFCCEKSCDALGWVAVIYSWILKASSSRDSSAKKPNSPLQSPNSSPRRKSDFGVVYKRLNFEFSSSSDSNGSDDEEYFLPKVTTRFTQLQKVRSNQIIQKRIPLNNIRKSPQKNFVKFSINSSSDYYDEYYSDDDDESNDKNKNSNNEKNDDDKKKLVNIRNCKSDNDVNIQRKDSDDSKYILDKLNEHYNAKNNTNVKNNTNINQKSNDSIQNDDGNDSNNSQFIMNKLTNYYRKKNEAANVIFQNNQTNADSHLVSIKKSSTMPDIKSNTKKIEMKQKGNENLKNAKQSTNSSENSTNLLAKQKNMNESKTNQNINKSRTDSSNNQNTINKSSKSLNDRITNKRTNNSLSENENIQQSNYSPNNNKNENNIEELNGESTFNFPSGGFELSFHSFHDSKSNKNPQEIQESFDSLFPYLDSKPDDDDDNEQSNESIEDFQANDNESIDSKLMHARKLISSIPSQSPTSKLKLTTNPIIVENFCHKDVVNSSIKTLVDSFTDIRNSTAENNEEDDEENCYNSFEKCDERSMDEAINSSLQKLENSRFNISDFVKIKDFPSFDFDQLLTNSTMKRPIVEEYAYSIQQIVSLASNEHLSIVKRIGVSINDFISKYSKHGNKLNSVTITESEESLRLCFLISALFLNGLKGFNSFGLENEFLDALRELTVHVSSLKEIYELVSTEKTILTQISKFVILLLNTQSLISVLDSILDQENWISEFYSSTSYLRDEETLRQIVICHSVVQNMNFDINENTNIIANVSYEDKIIFIFRPAYYFLQLDSIENSQNKEIIKSNVIDFFLKELINTTNGRGWQFLCLLADSNHTKLNCEVKLFRESILNAKKNVSSSEYDDNRIRAVLSDGLKYGLLHIWFIIMFTNQELTQQFFTKDSFFVDLYRANHILYVFADMISDNLLY